MLSIGNLTMGGTGKTPVLLDLCRTFLYKGITPAILSRGYAGVFSETAETQVVNGSANSDQQDLSDEIRLMMGRFPTVMIGVGADRFSSAKEILSKSSCDLFILDDGFQHWKLKRDFDLVCIDASDLSLSCLGLLPLGRQREGLSALKRAHAVLLTRTDLVSNEALSEFRKKISKVVPPENIFESQFELSFMDWQGSKVPKEIVLNNEKVVALSGIGNPEAFELSLKHDKNIVFPLRFEDHHGYSNQDLSAIVGKVETENAVLVTTEKDWVKLRSLDKELIQKLNNKKYVAVIELLMDPSKKELLVQRIMDRLKI